MNASRILKQLSDRFGNVVMRYDEKQDRFVCFNPDLEQPRFGIGKTAEECLRDAAIRCGLSKNASIDNLGHPEG